MRYAAERNGLKDRRMVSISVIVPVFNTGPYLPRCVDSLLCQTVRNIEVILIDDGSTDRSGEICDDYERSDSRVRVLHKPNGGLSDARNAGLRVATGDYVGFVDSDDYVATDMYERLLAACKNEQTPIAMCGRFDVVNGEIRERFTLPGPTVWDSETAIRNLLTWKNIDSAAWDKLFERRLFSSVRFPIGRYNEDIFVIPRLLHEAKTIAHIGEAGYFYCHRANSITSESFTEKKMDLLVAAAEARQFVYREYPGLSEAADSFYQRSIIFLLGRFKSVAIQKAYSESYEFLLAEVRRNLHAILVNRHTDIFNKVMAIVMATKMLGFFTWLYAPLASALRREHN